MTTLRGSRQKRREQYPEPSLLGTMDKERIARLAPTRDLPPWSNGAYPIAGSMLEDSNPNRRTRLGQSARS
jgi:hypothetical protein